MDASPFHSVLTWVISMTDRAVLTSVAGEVIVSFLVVWALTRWGLRLVLPRGLAQLPWTEQARHKHTAMQLLVFLPVFFVITRPVSTLSMGPVSLLDPNLAFLLLSLSSFCGATLGYAYLQARLGRSFSWSAMARGTVVTGVMFLPVWLLALPAMLVIEHASLSQALGVALLLVGGTYWLINRGGSLAIAKRVGLVVPASPELQRLAAALCRRQQLVPAPVLLIRSDAANAVAWPHLGLLGVTTGLVEKQSQSEVEAILRHEVGHLCEPKKVIRLRLLMAWTPVLLFLTLWMTRLFAVSTLVTAGLCCGAIILPSLLFGRLSRAMEDRADAYGVGQTPAKRAQYTRALISLYKANLTPVYTGTKGGSHPDLWQRLTNLGWEPEFTRPAAPVSRFKTVLLLLLASHAVMGARGVGARTEAVRQILPAHADVFVTGGAAASWHAIGQRHREAGDFPAARRSFRQAARRAPSAHYTALILTTYAEEWGCPHTDLAAQLSPAVQGQLVALEGQSVQAQNCTGSPAH